MTSPTKTKRGYDYVEPTDAPQSEDASLPPLTAALAVSAFRNVSACNRCRVRKNRCDQHLPSCSVCAKAKVPCVGYDPITKREIPRSYVFYLENRLSYLEELLQTTGIPFKPSEAFDPDAKQGSTVQSPPSSVQRDNGAESSVIASPPTRDVGGTSVKQEEDAERLEKLVSNIGMVSVHGASEKRYLGSTSGISFARVVLAAVKSSVSTSNSERNGVKPSKTAAGLPTLATSSMRDSYFGIQTKPGFKEAPFPDRPLGDKLVKLYFENANPQIPILHREDFKIMFEHAYSIRPEQRSAKELYMLNIVFAIGAGTTLSSSDYAPERSQQTGHGRKRPRLVSHQAQPEEYHASAIVHLGALLSGSHAAESGVGDLEELQAVLLLAGFALMRPVAPGLWYIVGVALRLAVDLGLHYEDGADPGDLVENAALSTRIAPHNLDPSLDASEKGRREFVRDLRRRLWWCVYSFDRLVSTCVGRPFGISDQVITTEFPCSLDDKYITHSGLLQPNDCDEPSYKRVAYHYFRLRLLQSEILSVLQYQQAQQTRKHGTNRGNGFMHTNLESPFLSRFNSFRSWRQDIDQRLWDWKESAPSQEENGVAFSVLFLDLNHWQAVIMLYRQSLTVPAQLAEELNPADEVESPTSTRLADTEDDHVVFLKSAEAGQKTLKLYRQLHRLHLINYTYLATHHLFMAGISFLYAVWHSPAVRARLTLDDFDFTVLAATSVLNDLIEKCPPAEACRDAFERMSKATVQMCMSTPAFGFSQERAKDLTTRNSHGTLSNVQRKTTQSSNQRQRPPPQFDMNLRDLFAEDLEASLRPSQSAAHPWTRMDLSDQSASSQAPQNPNTNQEVLSSSGEPLTSTNTGVASRSAPAQGQQQGSYVNESGLPPPYQDQFFGPDLNFLNFSATMDDVNLDSSALDIGYGIGMDYDHDWYDGQHIDLFDGFFFGDSNGAC